MVPTEANSIKYQGWTEVVDFPVEGGGSKQHKNCTSRVKQSIEHHKMDVGNE